MVSHQLHILITGETPTQRLVIDRTAILGDAQVLD